MRSKFKWIFSLLVAFTMQFSFAQQKTVTGVVSDESGPLISASVLIKNTSTGTTTDFDGKYSISAKPGDVLVFSFVGAATKEVTVGASNVYNVALATTVEFAGTTVVGALGIVRQRDAVVSAQKQISNEELNQAANPSAVQSLQGKVSGLNVSTTSNGVNSGTRIVIRGNRTISGDNQALIVIDNAISSAAVLSQLPPDLIESMNVVKGAQGAALYGAQGVNGVIIVTTRKGSKEEKFTLSVNSAIDFQSVSFVPEYQQEYGQGWPTDAITDPNGTVLNQFVPFENGSWGPAYNTPGFPSVLPVGLPQADGTFLYTEYAPIKDHLKQFFQTGTIIQNGFNFAVGGKDSYAFFSANRQTTDFVVENDRLKRNSFLFRAGKKIGKFNIDGNFNYITQNTSETEAGLYSSLIQTSTNVPIARFKNSGHEGHWTAYAKNPWELSKANRDDARSNIVNGIVAMGYEFDKNFNISYTGNVRITNTDAQSHNDAFTNLDESRSLSGWNYGGLTSVTLSDFGATGLTSNYFASQSGRRTIYSDLLFNFNFDLNEDINLKFNIGNNIQDDLFRVTQQGGTNLDVAGYYHINNVLQPANPSTLNNQLRRFRQVAGFVNADLAYKDYLFVNGTYRVEKTSSIADAYDYYSGGVSFIPTKAFDIKGDVLNYMKLNASYTRVGNSTAVAPYATNATATVPTGFPFGDLASLQYNRNPTRADISPEFVNTFEVGAQFGFFNDRVTIETSLYSAKTEDLITNGGSSSPAGQVTARGNLGDLSNKGFEIDLGLMPVRNENFKWTINANLAAWKTKVTALPEGVNQVPLTSGSTVVGIFAEVGEEFPLIKGTKFLRDPNGNYIVDSNGAHLKTSTFEKLGKGVPDYIVGLTNSFEYKGLKLTAVADFRYGGSVWSESASTLAFVGGIVESAGFDRNQGYLVPNSVQETSPGVYTQNTTIYQNDASTNGVQQYFAGNFGNTGEASVLDATALKIRELSLSYALPKKLIERAGIQSLRFGINARNPFIFLADGKLFKPKNGFANRSYVDPEASFTQGNAQGIVNTGQYPALRTIGGSINLTF